MVFVSNFVVVADGAFTVLSVYFWFAISRCFYWIGVTGCSQPSNILTEIFGHKIEILFKTESFFVSEKEI